MPDPKEALQELIDPRLADDYPIDSVLKVSDTDKPSSTTSFPSHVPQTTKRWSVNC
jgi:chitin elicitor receptor kinase 1